MSAAEVGEIVCTGLAAEGIVHGVIKIGPVHGQAAAWETAVLIAHTKCALEVGVGCVSVDREHRPP